MAFLEECVEERYKAETPVVMLLNKCYEDFTLKTPFVDLLNFAQIIYWGSIKKSTLASKWKKEGYNKLELPVHLRGFRTINFIKWKYFIYKSIVELISLAESQQFNTPEEKAIFEHWKSLLETLPNLMMVLKNKITNRQQSDQTMESLRQTFKNYSLGDFIALLDLIKVAEIKPNIIVFLAKNFPQRTLSKKAEDFLLHFYQNGFLNTLGSLRGKSNDYDLSLFRKMERSAGFYLLKQPLNAKEKSDIVLTMVIGQIFNSGCIDRACLNYWIELIYNIYQNDEILNHVYIATYLVLKQEDKITDWLNKRKNSQTSYSEFKEMLAQIYAEEVGGVDLRSFWTAESIQKFRTLIENKKVYSNEYRENMFNYLSFFCATEDLVFNFEKQLRATAFESAKTRYKGGFEFEKILSQKHFHANLKRSQELYKKFLETYLLFGEVNYLMKKDNGDHKGIFACHCYVIEYCKDSKVEKEYEVKLRDILKKTMIVTYLKSPEKLIADCNSTLARQRVFKETLNELGFGFIATVLILHLYTEKLNSWNPSGFRDTLLDFDENFSTVSSVVSPDKNMTKDEWEKIFEQVEFYIENNAAHLPDREYIKSLLKHRKQSFTEETITDILSNWQVTFKAFLKIMPQFIISQQQIRKDLLVKK